MEHDDEHDQELLRHLGQLPRDVSPPSGLEDRVLAAARVGGLVRHPPADRAGWLVYVAAGLVLFLAGAWFGRGAAWPGTGQAVRTDEPTFALLLYPDHGFVEGSREDETRRVAEYTSWAADLRRDGRLVLGEKLGDAHQELRAVASATPEVPLGGSDGARQLAGLFLVRARDLTAAVDLARGCPHLRHGGRVVVRPVESSGRREAMATPGGMLTGERVWRF